MAEAGLEAEFIAQDAGSLPDRVALAAKSGAEAVIVAGGDGTVACAGHALAGSDIPLGVLPYGTMNLLAKDLGLPIGDLPAALKAIAAGAIRTIDVGEVNGQSFLCASMLGLPVQLGRTTRADAWLKPQAVVQDGDGRSTLAAAGPALARAHAAGR